MTSIQEFQPDWASAPGETIIDILQERNLSTADFTRQLGHTHEEISNLLSGRATITLATARKLEQILGASVEFWMSRDFQYRQDVARLHIVNQKWLAALPLSDMIRFGWLRPIPHPSEEVAACLRFFDVPSVEAWHEAYADLQELVTFRTSLSFESRPAAVATWLRQGEIEAQAIDCLPWNPKRFRESLQEIRLLTKQKDPERFLPKLQQRCADSGVAVVIVRAPNGCRASGATRFLTEKRALILLSFRYLTDDHFWFTFFHEAGHLLLHSDKEVFLEGLEPISEQEEKEANEFASSVLIPPKFHEELMSLPINRNAVIRFAVKIGIAPGIVVGQLQYLEKVRYDRLNRLKRRYNWI